MTFSFVSNGQQIQEREKFEKRRPTYVFDRLRLCQSKRIFFINTADNHGLSYPGQTRGGSFHVESNLDKEVK